MALVFLVYFSLLGVLGFVIWVNFIINLSSDGGEMADSIFQIFLTIATIYYGVMLVWTYSLYRNKTQ